jgi:hypothetical protein
MRNRAKEVEMDDQITRAEREAVVQRFAEAWGAGDVDSLMLLMAPIPTFRGSVGEGPGSVFKGHAEVRAAFSKLVVPAPHPVRPQGDVPASPSNSLRPEGEVFHFGDRCLTFWSLPGLDGDGQPVAVEGVDVFTFDEGNRVVCKDAYRKALPSSVAPEVDDGTL